MPYTIALRPKPEERETIRAAAKRRGLPLSRFVINAALKEAAEAPRRFSSLDIEPDYRMPAEASENPKRFIRKKLEAKRAVHR